MLKDRGYAVSALSSCLVAVLFAGGCQKSGGFLDRCAVPARHQPVATMGRDCWRVLNKYSAYGCTRDTRPTNPDIISGLDLSNVAYGYVASADKPSFASGYAVWPKLADNFRPTEPDRELLTSNPEPDRPFFLNKRGERNPFTWALKPKFEEGEYAAWRAAHPNLVVDGHISEWCNDLNNAFRRSSGEKVGYMAHTSSEEERARLRELLGAKPTNRYEMVALLRRYFDMRKARNYGGKMAVMDAHLHTQHIAADCGADFLDVETTCSGYYRYNLAAMFTRGAARQFALPWRWYIAGYKNGPAKFVDGILWDAMCRYPTKDNPTGKPRYAPRKGAGRLGNGGPDFGMSRSLFRRTHYLAYVSGANFIALEEPFSVLYSWDDAAKQDVLSPRGQIYAEFAAFMRRNPARGAHYSPVGICVPLAQGYPTFGGSSFCMGFKEHREDDQVVDALFKALVPPVTPSFNEGLKAGVESHILNSPYADMFDVIAPDATRLSADELLASLRSYRELIVVGRYRDTAWEKTLARYEAEGGRVHRLTPANAGTAGELLASLTKAHFPFEVTGDCLYGLSVAQDHAWLYLFNNKGITKFADAPQEIEASATVQVTVRVPCACQVRDLLTNRAVPVSDGAFACTIPAGDFTILEVR